MAYRFGCNDNRNISSFIDRICSVICFNGLYIFRVISDVICNALYRIPVICGNRKLQRLFNSKFSFCNGFTVRILYLCIISGQRSDLISYGFLHSLYRKICSGHIEFSLIGNFNFYRFAAFISEFPLISIAVIICRCKSYLATVVCGFSRYAKVLGICRFL